MSGSEQATRTALYVFAPVYVSSSSALGLVRLERNAHDAARFALGDRAIRIPAGVYRVESSAMAPVRVICDDDAIETVAIGGDDDGRPLRGRLREFLGDVSQAELARFLAAPSRALADDRPSEVDETTVARLFVRHQPPEACARFHVESEDTVRIAVFGPREAEPIIGEGSVDAELPPGLYRVRYERCGAAVEQIVDHVDDTVLRHAGPPLVTPAPISGAATSEPDYIAAAKLYS